MANKKNLLTIILVVLIVVNIAALTAIFFFHRPFEQRQDHEGRHHRMADDFLKKELNLSETQTKQMDQLKAAHKDTLTFWANQMRERRDFLTMEMMKTSPDDSVLNAACDEIGVIYATIRKLNIVHYREMKALCNDEQKKKLDTVFKSIFCGDEPMLCRFHKDKGPGCGMHKEGKHEGCGMDKEEKHEGCWEISN
jgi:hypothetical protein